MQIKQEADTLYWQLVCCWVRHCQTLSNWQTRSTHNGSMCWLAMNNAGRQVEVSLKTSGLLMKAFHSMGNEPEKVLLKNHLIAKRKYCTFKNFFELNSKENSEMKIVKRSLKLKPHFANGNSKEKFFRERFPSRLEAIHQKTYQTSTVDKYGLCKKRTG